MWGTEGHPQHEGITGVTFAFAWHRAQLRVLIAGWLDEVRSGEMQRDVLGAHG
jgi:hypothetical protein